MTTAALAAPPRSAAPPAGPRGLPLLGAALRMARDPLRFFPEVAREYGDIAHFRIGRTPLYLVSHPSQIQEVLVGRHKDSTKDELTRGLSAVVGQGLLTSEGATWRRQRKLAAPSFSRKDIAVYGDAMVDSARRLLTDLRDGEVREVHADMTRVTLEIVVRTLFDVRDVPHSGLVGETMEGLLTSYRRSKGGLQRFLPGWIPTPARRRIRRGTARIDEILFEIIHERRAEGPRGSDLLSRLLAAEDEHGEPMSDRQLRDELVTFFLAGHETTAIALTAAIFLLARHPEARAAAEREVDELLAGRPASAADVRELRYLDAVVREAMRLYPPAWIMGREAVRDFEVGGAHIPTGAQVLMSQWVVHRDPRWYDEPERFRPERWQEGLADRIPRYAYFPFGGGPRVCIGNHFAQMEAVLVLATLLQEVRLEAGPEATLDLEPAVTLRPTGPVEMTVRRRAPRGGKERRRAA